MTIFEDNFKIESKPYGTGVVHKNYPKLVLGTPKLYVEDYESNVRIVLMDTGLLYYRYLTYDKNSPYGYSPLHEKYIPSGVGKKKYEEFESLIKYEILVHTANLRGGYLHEYGTLIDKKGVELLIKQFNEKQKATYLSTYDIDNGKTFNAFNRDIQFLEEFGLDGQYM